MEVDNKIWQEDIERLANEEIFNGFKNKTVLITGATGLIGSELVFSFMCANRIKENNTKIVALARNIEKAKKLFKNIIDNPNFELIVSDIREKLNYDNKIDYVIHCANVTSSKDMVEKPVETSLIAIDGTKNILDFAKEKRMESLIFLSSLEVYGLINKDELIKEDDFGYIDLLNPRSSYPESKRMAENLCISYASQYDLNIKIARLTQTFGAGVDESDKRVFAEFTKRALKDKKIVLHTLGKTTRNYCYLTDAINGILTILLKGENKKAYNVSNIETKMTILEMAETIAKKTNAKVEFQIDNTERGYNPEIKACLDASLLEKLNWKTQINKEEMFERLIGFFKLEMGE